MRNVKTTGTYPQPSALAASSPRPLSQYGAICWTAMSSATQRCNQLDATLPPSLDPMVQSVGPQSSISVWVQCIGPQSPRGKGAMYWPAKSAFTWRYGATYWSARDWAHGAVNWSAEDLSTTWCSSLVRNRTLYDGAMNWPAGG